MADPLGLGKSLSQYSDDEWDRAVSEKRAAYRAEHGEPGCGHGVEYVRVGVRPGYKGVWVCPVCYFTKGQS